MRPTTSTHRDTSHRPGPNPLPGGRGDSSARAPLFSASIWLIACAAALLPATPAQACACCSEHGERTETTQPIDPYLQAEVDRIRFSPTANLYANAADPSEYAAGIRAPSSKYNIKVSRTGDRWTLSFRDAAGNTGTLAFSLPKTAEVFAVDTQTGNPSTGTSPPLYKELRFRAPVSGTGIFAPGMQGNPSLRLIFQGRGNNCTEAEQFTNFWLNVSGPKARFTFFGPLAPPAPRP